MISITQYERVAEALGFRLEYNFRSDCHTLFSGVIGIDGNLQDERFRRLLHDTLAPRALDFLIKAPESDPRRHEVVSFLNHC